MSKYVWRDDQGRTLYKGEVVAGRRWKPASRIGYGVPIVAGTLWAAILVIVADLPWVPVVLVMALLIQIWITLRQRAYSRAVWDSITDLPARSVDTAIDEQAAKLEDKIKYMEISLDAEIAYIDYEDGEILTPDELPAAIEELARRLEALDAIKAVHTDLDRADDLYGDRPGEIEMRHPTPAVPHRRPEIVRGRPVNRSAARRARLSDGRIVELTNDDLALILTMGGAHFGPDVRVTTPSGIELSGRDVAGLTEEVRALSYVDHCPHGFPRHERCANCEIDLRTQDGLERASALLSMTHGQEPRPVGGPRTRSVIRRDLDQLAGRVRAGKVSGLTANSLRADLIEEWQRAPEDAS